MLSGITNMLFGTNDATNNGEEMQVELKTSPADNEWVLVDKASMENLYAGCYDVFFSVKTLFSDTCSGPKHSRRVISQESKENSPTHCVLVKNNALVPLEESWFVTPPPCFTAGGHLGNMVSSPMENLLIEHPSMSVYGQQMNSETLESSIVEESEKRSIVHHPPHRPRAVAARAGLNLRVQAMKSMQTAQHRNNTRYFTRSKMEHQNKVHHANSSKKHHKRDHLIQPASRSFAKRC